MASSKIISEQPALMAEVKEELEKIQKRDTEQGFRAQKTLEYLNTFAKLSLKDAHALKKEIEDLSIPRLAEAYVVKIVDLLPETVDEVKVVLQGYAVTVTKENMQKIVDCVKKYK